MMLHALFCPGFQLRRNHRLGGCLALGLAGLLLPVAALAQSSLSETFSGPALGAGLELSLEDSYTFDGLATNTADTRAYIRTVATNFNTVDFSLAATYTVSHGAGGAGIAFFGLGLGARDTGFYNEPLTAGYLRSFPDDFGDGASQLSINSGPGSVNELTAFGYPGAGTHRVLITKSGDTITFAIDANSLAGAFTSDYSATLSLSADLPFLDATNSRLFLGSESAAVTFDSMVITSSVPEPGTAGLIAGLAGLGVILAARHRRIAPAGLSR